MAEKIQIVIEPPESHPDFLTLQDAMEQVLDYFQLVSIDEKQDSQNIIWKLVSVSMKSPFTVTAEAFSFDSSVNIDELAKKQKEKLRYGTKSILKGITPDEWTSAHASKIIERILKRSNNGIGKTRIILDTEIDSVPIEITPQIADSAMSEIHKQPARLFSEDLSHKELGSIDGYLVAAGSDYDHPALRIRDRLTQDEIWCRVPEEIRNNVSESMHLNDVWEHIRVIVSGMVSYEKTGKISRIIDAQIEHIVSRDVSIDAIRDSGFTQGISPSEYLKKLREGNLD
ncbi:MAG: hypothetical protein ABSD50_04000 [Smithella sp.]